MRKYDKKIQINDVVSIIKKAGGACLEKLNPDVVIQSKDDDSPVTEADKASHHIITQALGQLTPDIPVLSEEGTAEEQRQALHAERHWVIDPIDGTRAAINYAKGRNHDGFAVNIALVENGEPTLGLVYYPARDTLYYTGDDGKAYKQIAENPPKQIQASRPPLADPIRAAVSWKSERRPFDIAGKNYEAIPEVGGGRMCLVAEGKTDIAILNQPLSQWDVAAGHAILRCMGAELIEEETGKPPLYDRENFSILPSVAASRETLKLLGFANDLPKPGRGLGD